MSEWTHTSGSNIFSDQNVIWIKWIFGIIDSMMNISDCCCRQSGLASEAKF